MVKLKLEGPILNTYENNFSQGSNLTLGSNLLHRGSKFLNRWPNFFKI
jgi:hypothetical protein